MKLLKNVILAGTGTVLLASSQVFADPSWDECSVGKIGVAGEDSQLVQMLGCETAANSGKWLSLFQQEKNFLATLLTARALGSQVSVKADFDTATNNASPPGNLYNMYLLP